MHVATILICHFLIGFLLVDVLIKILPEYWKDKFEENALEADEMQDVWYENEKIIYLLIVCLGSLLAAAMIIAKIHRSVKRFFKPKAK